MLKLFLAACCFLPMCFSAAQAQQNEVSISVGGGSLVSQGESLSAPTFTLAYTRNLPARFAVEGALEVFFVPIRGFGRDGFGGVQGAVLYHFRSPTKPQRLIPYLTVGVGKTTTDFTEIPGESVVRLGGGVKYFFSEAFGLRVEMRDEIISNQRRTIPWPGSSINFPSARVGIIYRF